MEEKDVTPMVYDKKEIKKMLKNTEPPKQKIEQEYEHDYYEISKFFMKIDLLDFVNYEKSFKEYTKEQGWNKLKDEDKIGMIDSLLVNLEGFNSKLFLPSSKTLCYILMGVPCENEKEQIKMIYSNRNLALETEIISIVQNLFLYYSYQVL